MAHKTTKIATCCYCGAQALLKLSEIGARHELSCASCGALLHNMKQMPIAPPARAQNAKPQAQKAISHRPPPKSPPPPAFKTKKRRKRSLWSRLIERAEDLWDEIEDVFD